MAKLNLQRSNLLLILIFITAASLIFFVAGLTFKQLQKLSDNTGWMYHSQAVSLDLEHLYANLKDIETERRNLILNDSDADAVGIIKQRMAQNKQLLDKLRYETRDNPQQQFRLKKLSALIDQKYKIVEDAFQSKFDYAAHPMLVKDTLLAGKVIMYKIKSAVDEMMDAEASLLEKRRSEFLFSEKSTPVYLYIISVLSLLVLGFAFFQTFRDLRILRESNSRLKMALDTSRLAEKLGNYGVWTYSESSGQYRFSENARELLGLMKNQTDFGSIAGRFAEDDFLALRHHIRGVALGANVEPFVTRFKNNDGEQRHFINNIETITAADGKKMLLGITRDITQEVANRAELAEANRNLQFYYSSSRAAERIGNYGFWRWTKSDDKYWFSDNLYQIFGMRSRKAKNLDEITRQVHPKDVALFKEKLEQMYSGAVVEDFNYRIYRKNDGKLRHLNMIARKMDWNGGTSYLIITRDVTDQVAASQNLEAQNRLLDTNNRELQAFNYVASHDLQEPLRKIETFIGRLWERDYDQLSESGKQYLDKTKASAGRMRMLIDDLLQFSRSTRGDAAFETTDLNLLLEDAKETLQAQIEQKSAQIVAEHLPTLDVIPFQIKQLFTNLIGNSLKYSKASAPPVIHISCDRISADQPLPFSAGATDYVRLIFRDNGIGFNNHYSEKIFQLFNRLHGKSEYEGTGIGLAICKKIVENHKGYISAEGFEGMGAQFTVFLPLKIS